MEDIISPADIEILYRSILRGVKNENSVLWIQCLLDRVRR